LEKGTHSDATKAICMKTTSKNSTRLAGGLL
jgi:hypothetical protein